MQMKSRGISTILAVVVVIVIIGAAAGAYYFVAYPGGGSSTNNTTTSSSSSSHSSSSSSSSTSSVSSSSTGSSTTQHSSSSTSSSVQSSSQSATSTQSSGTTTMSCTNTSTTSTSTQGAAPLNFANLFRNFSEMAISYQVISNGTALNYTSSYNVIYLSGSTFKINLTSEFASTNQNYTVWVKTNGTVLAVYMSTYGQNLTGSIAELTYTSSMLPFLTEVQYGNQLGLYTSSTYFHETGTGTAHFGPTMMAVTNYAANSLPTVITTCESSLTLNEFSLQTGAVPSSNLQILTMMHMKGTGQSSSGPYDIEFTETLVSITKA